MQVIQKIEELRQHITHLKDNSLSIGLVPTMGALHNGHISLIQKAKEENQKIIVSIFVNPKQFGKGEDFERYPRTLQTDIDICQKAGVDILFTPDADEIYHNDPIKILAPSKSGNILEGARRKGHFDGVLEIVLRLLNLTQANRAYFGKKDAQQLLIIQQMVRNLFLPVKIVGCPIIRDSKGLALSSRNRYLSKAGYEQALQIPLALETIGRKIMGGEYCCESLKQIGLESLRQIEVDYLAIVDHQLNDIKEIKKNESLILLVAKIEGVRLLDNLWI
ncbi:pantoate--beta-alanine ligase [Helicobacter monodelphidis]|uniref:pantoate--beta-alanine ligase n=1 Tax=Helicobacter sp. 15-1451 TaxID=2004995 RepID=UPI000DCD415A|nr:pantoate--beta-alanine ligase [Helicobacter sp. 15-1451]RAX57431.1 pantoate--beta-alanine ligase [Helicobacter sp. 15-1451]